MNLLLVLPLLIPLLTAAVSLLVRRSRAAQRWLGVAGQAALLAAALGLLASVWGHFLLNLAHVLLFTYPLLAPR